MDTQSDIAIKIKLDVAPITLKDSIMECINSIVLPKGSFLNNFDPLTES